MLLCGDRISCINCIHIIHIPVVSQGRVQGVVMRDGGLDPALAAVREVEPGVAGLPLQREKTYNLNKKKENCLANLFTILSIITD